MLLRKIFWLLLVLPELLFAQGSLLLVGGGAEYSSWADEPFRWFIAAANFGKIMNIDVNPVSPEYPDYFKSLGADTSSCAYRIPTRTAANDSHTYKILCSARGIFIEGGDQGDYVRTWKGTRVQDAIHAVFQNGGVIGGTSAGLAVLGEVVYDATGGYLYPDKAAYNPYHPDIRFTDDFLKILPNVLTDSHFHPRGRLARLVPMLARRIVDNGQKDLMGVGVCENTALCIDLAGNGKVMGDATVTIIYQAPDSRIDCQPGRPLSFTNIVYHQLTRDAVFNFNTRELVAPGAYLVPVTAYQINNQFSPVTLNGSDDALPNLGTVIVKGLTSQDLAAWKGQLTQTPGENKVPNSVIINKLLWENAASETYFYENRWVGGMWAIANQPGFRAIYVNGDADKPNYNGVAEISDSGILTVQNGILYILDTHTMTHQGNNYSRTGNRATNYRGMFNARLHFLKAGDQFDLKTSTQRVEPDTKVPARSMLNLFQNYPNPFNETTAIQFTLTENTCLQLEIYDISGATVTTLANGFYTAGDYHFIWDGRNAQGQVLASGIKFCRFSTAKINLTRKLMFLR
ncbi:Type 1 glutamine amidotransferase-like domain-containing protein [candidate division KSB1 bacterium]|nr:Type 1 glutamine amidotransferase-like domain-containing protein [candidate division KSB1 bacterium]